MDKMLRLDMHTHCFEAMNYPEPDPVNVSKIIEEIEKKGLDGIAVTEHNDIGYGLKARDIAERILHTKVIILPGREIDIRLKDSVTGVSGELQIVEILIPNKTYFRYLAHPGYPSRDWKMLLPNVYDIKGIEVKNGNHSIDFRDVMSFAETEGLRTLCSSDAHLLQDVGTYFSELEISFLYT